MQTINTLLAESNSRVIRAEAEILLSHILNQSRATIIATPQQRVTDTDATTFRTLIARRMQGEPLAYLTGTKEFYGRTFTVTPDVLIPRPETEILVEHALVIAQKHSNTQKREPLIIVDVGTGSGAIIITLATELAAHYTTHRCGFLATDISIEALHIANNNARTFDVANQIAFIKADLLTPLLTNGPLTRMLRLGAHLLICANLPYVDSAQRTTLIERPESRGLAFEPAEALWADDNGLALYNHLLTQLANIRTIAPQAPLTVFCEIDPAQEYDLISRIHALFPFAHTTPHPDLSGRTRLIEIMLHTQE